MTTQTLLIETGQRRAIADLRRNGGTQLRVDGTDPERVDEYRALYIGGRHLPPVIVFDDGKDLWLADGFHRVEAAAAAGWTDIPCEIRAGTRTDAVLFALAANASHGLRRSNEDLRHAIRCALLDHDLDLARRTDTALAALIVCSPGTIARVRAELVAAGEIEDHRVRIDEQGRETHVRSAAADDDTDDQVPGHQLTLATARPLTLSELDPEVEHPFGADYDVVRISWAGQEREMAIRRSWDVPRNAGPFHELLDSEPQHFALERVIEAVHRSRNLIQVYHLTPIDSVEAARIAWWLAEEATTAPTLVCNFQGRPDRKSTRPLGSVYDRRTLQPLLDAAIEITSRTENPIGAWRAWRRLDKDLDVAHNPSALTATFLESLDPARDRLRYAMQGPHLVTVTDPVSGEARAHTLRIADEGWRLRATLVTDRIPQSHRTIDIPEDEDYDSDQQLLAEMVKAIFDEHARKVAQKQKDKQRNGSNQANGKDNGPSHKELLRRAQQDRRNHLSRLLVEVVNQMPCPDDTGTLRRLLLIFGHNSHADNKLATITKSLAEPGAPSDAELWPGIRESIAEDMGWHFRGETEQAFRDFFTVLGIDIEEQVAAAYAKHPDPAKKAPEARPVTGDSLKKRGQTTKAKKTKKAAKKKGGKKATKKPAQKAKATA